MNSVNLFSISIARQFHLIMVVMRVCQKLDPGHCCHLQRFEQAVQGIR